MEIEIHRSLSHMHVVGFHGFFEDKDHVYILLELCRRRSLMELHKRRKALSEPEARYYIRQTLLAVKYLHNVKVGINGLLENKSCIPIYCPPSFYIIVGGGSMDCVCVLLPFLL